MPAKEKNSVSCHSVIGSFTTFYHGYSYTCGRGEYIEVCTGSEGNEMDWLKAGIGK
jgi:hypothetical protein